MNKLNHTSIQYVQGHKNARLIANDNRFQNMEELQPELFEVELGKQRITENLPLYVGYMVLQYAKLRMLEWFHDFLMVFFRRDCIEKIQMDTDSSYFGLAAPSLEDIFKNQEMADKYNKAVYGSCGITPFLPNNTDRFIVRKCCTNCTFLDNLQPSFFKCEFLGTCMVALCSKTYAGENKQNGEVKELKYSSKGLNKKAVLQSARKQNLSLVGLYKKVLDTMVGEHAINKGIKRFGQSVMSYNQTRMGLSFFYCKRRVLDDYVSTVPLDVVLTPHNR